MHLMEPSRLFCSTYARTLTKRKSVERLIFRSEWIWKDEWIPEILERLSSAQVRGYVAKLGHGDIVDYKHFAHFGWKIICNQML